MNDSQATCRMCGNPVTPRQWGGGECERCGSVSATSLPEKEELSDFYLKFNESYTGGGSSRGRNLLRYAKRYLQYIEKYVKEMGGGLVMIGGDSSFGAGHYKNTPVEKALPVFMDAPADLRFSRLCLIFVIDKQHSRIGQHHHPYGLWCFRFRILGNAGQDCF